jgi:hypothetical protein
MNGQFYPGVMLGRTLWLVNEGTKARVEIIRRGLSLHANKLETSRTKIFPQFRGVKISWPRMHTSRAISGSMSLVSVMETSNLRQLYLSLAKILRRSDFNNLRRVRKPANLL